MSNIEGPNKKGRPLGRGKDRKKEYTSERGTGRRGRLEEAKREHLAREMWELSAAAIPLGTAPGGSEASYTIDR